MNRKFCINYHRIINISSFYDLIINFSNRIHYKKEWGIKKNACNGYRKSMAEKIFKQNNYVKGKIKRKKLKNVLIT